jgi:hypothetical protein
MIIVILDKKILANLGMMKMPFYDDCENAHDADGDCDGAGYEHVDYE